MVMYTRDGVIAVAFPYPVHLLQPKRDVSQEKGLKAQASGLCRLIEVEYMNLEHQEYDTSVIVPDISMKS
jgi:hypothetical protein